MPFTLRLIQPCCTLPVARLPLFCTSLAAISLFSLSSVAFPTLRPLNVYLAVAARPRQPSVPMAAKPKFFSWSKGRHSTAEPYHRTGGLLPIDTSVGEPSAGEHHRRTLSTGDAKVR